MSARKRTSIKVPPHTQKENRLKKAMKEAKNNKGTYHNSIDSLLIDLKR
jgi:hypothetical protein